MSVELNVRKYYQHVNQSEYSQLSTTDANLDGHNVSHSEKRPIVDKRFGTILVSVCTTLLLISSVFFMLKKPVEVAEVPVLGSAWSSKAEPFSFVDPTSLGILSIDRPASSKPGRILDNLISVNSDSHIPETPLPTNTWYQNLILGDSNTDPENKIFQIPHIIDTAGYIRGIRTHPCHLQANDRMVMMNFEPKSGVVLGAVETFLPQHYVHKHEHGAPATISKLAIELEWVTEQYRTKKTGSTIRTPIVRGSPYTSMKYFDATPRLFVERMLSGKIVVDNNPAGPSPVCGSSALGTYTAAPFTVEKEVKIQFDTSDMTWLVFVSEPTEFVCTNFVAPPSYGPSIPGVPPVEDVEHSSFFDMKATKPMHKGMVRVAMSNNCTVGQNPQHCDNHMPRNQSDYESLLRAHANVYPTAEAEIQFTFPVFSSEEEELRLILDWKPAYMSDMAIASSISDFPGSPQPGAPAVETIPPVELLMFALPHHQERLRPTAGSSNAVKKFGCQANLHGFACPVLGASWSMVEHLHRTSFSAPRPPRAEMLPAIQAALKQDILYRPPQNYMDGAGDTYFSGKMLAKLGRILLVANDVGGVEEADFAHALATLREGVEVWYRQTAGSPFLYDRAWGGIVMCGCDYKWENNVGFCANSYPNCPALSDFGQNFGAGYYNDHHYHFGYHIYAAAVVAKFDPAWGRSFHQHVLLLVRDIVNPSDDDKFFPTWRHKDWYLGFSWASGIVTIQGKPYPNGRNQESASEAIAAYEAVALYGDAMADIFSTNKAPEDGSLLQNALRIRDMGRLLMATEIRSMQTYWHVQAPDTEDVSRVYPDIYQPKVIGMMWSMLAQMQTWFGNEAWKSYGIQLMPITPASELRDSSGWLKEMLPGMNDSCRADTNCAGSGWDVLIYACLSAAGDWKAAWAGAMTLNEDAFLDAGGNGHSLSNTLWYIATRPENGNAALPIRYPPSGEPVDL